MYTKVDEVNSAADADDQRKIFKRLLTIRCMWQFCCLSTMSLSDNIRSVLLMNYVMSTRR
jgi:hypothetical protein